MDITATTGNVDLNNSVASIDFNGAGSTNIITATAGAVELEAITDSAAVTELEINAGTNITLNSVTLDDGTATLDINLDTGADDAATLNVTGLLNAGTITANGQGVNDVMNFGDGAGDTVTSTNADITIDTANIVSFTDDIVGATGVTIQNINTDINLGADVDVTATTGNVDLNNTVTAIDLNGAGTNRITATAGAVELAAVDDSANIAEFEINAGTDITLDSVVLDNGGTSLLDVNLDTGAGGSETLNVTGALTAASITVDGQGTNDDMTFGGLVTTNTGSLLIDAANLATFNGGISAATDIDVGATGTVTTVAAAAGTTTMLFTR